MSVIRYNGDKIAKKIKNLDREMNNRLHHPKHPVRCALGKVCPSLLYSSEMKKKLKELEIKKQKMEKKLQSVKIAYERKKDEQRIQAVISKAIKTGTISKLPPAWQKEAREQRAQVKRVVRHRV